jgi:hypothetical protein
MFTKLSLNYPIADPADWLIFLHTWQWEIDPIFLGRLAALGKTKNKKINISSGIRSYDEQVKSYKSTGGYQDKKGNWIGGNGKACKPGTSWHEYGEAIDTSDSWLKALDKNATTVNQKTLLQFGLFKPLTPGNKTIVNEDWHIQPIETNGIATANRKTFYIYKGKPVLNYGDKGDEVKLAQMFLNAKGFNCGLSDGSFGQKTSTAVMAFQKANGLQPDGTVGSLTWRRLIYNK